jgi:segregation and condensation protein A
MSEVIPFEEEAGREPGDSESFRLDLEGYEGPIDVLLQLARDQKVDITRLSILELAEQYLEFVRRARKLRLELAADYLVMAAWLAYLKSRLLIPSTETAAAPGSHAGCGRAPAGPVSARPGSLRPGPAGAPAPAHPRQL